MALIIQMQCVDLNGSESDAYGDGVADVDIGALIAFHQSEGRKATLTAVQPPGRFGSLAFERGRVLAFEEKPQGDGSWINGGFFVLDPSVIDLVDGDQCTWEQKPLQTLAETGQLSAFHHTGFWQPCDTLRDKRELEVMRQRRESDQARQDQYRHQLALAGQAYSTEDEHRRLAREQCLRERRVDCDSPSTQAYSPYYPTIVARPARQTIQQVSPFPVTGPVVGPAPGTIAGSQALLGPFRAATTTVTRSASLRTAR
jgi:hypothetical protein